MIDLPRAFGSASDPPWWRPAAFRPTNDGTAKAAIGAHVACPAGHVRAVEPGAIAPNGTAEVSCNDCGWHHRARLTGWNHGSRP